MSDKRLSQLTVFDAIASDFLTYGVQGGVSGSVPRSVLQQLILDTLPQNSYFIIKPTVTLVDNVITFSPSSWVVSGGSHTNAADVSLTIPYANEGKTRIDLFVATSANTYVRVPGVESDSNPVREVAGPNQLQVAFLIITDGTISTPIESTAGRYIDTFTNEEDFDIVVMHPNFGDFGFIKSTGVLELAIYSGTAWQFYDLLSGGATPSLPQVLAVGDRLTEDVGMDVIYSFKLIDRTKNVLSDSNATFVLDGDVAFPSNSVLIFSCPIGVNTLSFINGATIYFNGAVLTTDLVMPSFSKGYLTCTDAPAKTWILNYKAGSVDDTKVVRMLVSQTTYQYTDNSNPLTIGHQYKIITYNAGDDFSNQTLISGVVNETNSIFECTNDTAIDWTNGSLVLDLTASAPALVFLKDDSGETHTPSYIGLGDFIITSTGAPWVLGQTSSPQHSSFYVNEGDNSLATLVFRFEDPNIITIGTADFSFNRIDNALYSKLIEIYI